MSATSARNEGSGVLSVESRPGERHGEDGGVHRPPRLLDVAGLARVLGVEERFVRRLVAERRIPYVKVGKYVRFDVLDVVAWVDERRVEPMNQWTTSHRRRA